MTAVNSKRAKPESAKMTSIIDLKETPQIAAKAEAEKEARGRITSRSISRRGLPYVRDSFFVTDNKKSTMKHEDRATDQ
mgnify:CR=1 FL=1